MREIKFRGKRQDNGKWTEGQLLISDNDYFIIPNFGISCIENIEENKGYICDSMITLHAFKIDHSTIGQYTGLHDDNGKEIYEGDIVKFKHGGEFSEKGIYYRNYAVEFINTLVTYGLRLRNKSIHFPFKQATASMHDVKIIGNIYDNSELLEMEE